MSSRWPWVMALVAACGGSPARDLAPTPNPAQQERPAVPPLPTCSSGTDLARLDGQRVVVVGVYRKRLVAKKMGQPATQFYGHVQLELAGHATDYDPSAPDGAPAMVRLGSERRADDEIARFADHPVAVEGRLVVTPPPTAANVATTMPVPTLTELGAITPR